MTWGDADAEPVQNVVEPVCRGQRGEQSTWGCEESLTVVLAQDKGREIFQSKAPQSHTDMQPVERISVMFL